MTKIERSEIESTIYMQLPEAKVRRRGTTFCAVGALVALLLTGCSKSPQTNAPADSMSTGASANRPAVDYKPRVGLAVSTAARSCVAIANANITSGTPVTLISVTMPQTIATAQVGSVAQSACPITQDVDPAVTNYDLQLGTTKIPKLVPYVAIVGSAGASVTGGGKVQTNLDQNGSPQSFRSCSSPDGIHVTMWNGQPLTGGLLWHGFYYDPSQAAKYPACSPKELNGL